MNEIMERYQELTSTFVPNSAKERLSGQILDLLKKDAVEKRMRLLRASSAYERGALKYYSKYGTAGEF